MMSAVGRGLHRLLDPRPWVFDDPYALSLVGPDWTKIRDAMNAVFREPVLRQATAAMVARARYTEDRLRAGTFIQYVILGAGLDSIAWRCPDLLRDVRLFEIDHPATQAWKRERARALSLPANGGHVFAPVDFETATIQDGLDATGFDWSQRTLFAWLGVTQYLTVDAVQATLRTVASCRAGSEIVLTYIPTTAYLDTLGQEFIDTLSSVAAERGEPLQALLAPADAQALVERDCGLRIGEHLTRDDLHDRYFAGRSDGLTPPTTQRIIAARVPA